MTTVSAYEARRNFGEILNRVAYKGESVVVERHGRPLAEIRPAKKTVKKKPSRDELIKKYAGIWDNEDGRRIEKAMKEFRSSFKVIRDR